MHNHNVYNWYTGTCCLFLSVAYFAAVDANATTTLFLGNLSFQATEESIKALFTTASGVRLPTKRGYVSCRYYCSGIVDFNYLFQLSFLLFCFAVMLLLTLRLQRELLLLRMSTRVLRLKVVPSVLSMGKRNLTLLHVLQTNLTILALPQRL